MRYAIVIEKASGNYCGYVPDLPGCVATGKTQDDVRKRLRDAVQLHIHGLREDGLQVPKPEAEADYIETAA